MHSEELSIAIEGADRVSALLLCPPRPKACYVFAHGAGAGMRHGFMAAVSTGLAERAIATLRYQFPYMEAGRKRPDTPATAHAAVRAAVAEVAKRYPGMTVIAGGKSFGGRMTSQAEAIDHLDGVKGLAFFGFPLHPAAKPSIDRANHLSDVGIPMLFLQGTKDALADEALMTSTVAALGSQAALHLVQDADHSFHVPRRSGRDDAMVLEEILDVFHDWVETLKMPVTE